MTLSIKGTARSLQFVEPSLVGRFFGNNSYLFVVDAGEEVQVTVGVKLRFVPIRHECFLRLPSFEGSEVVVNGDFDKFDFLVQAKLVSVVDWKLKIGAVRQLSLLNAFLFLLLPPLVLAAMIALSREYYQNLVQSIGQSSSIAILAVGLLITLAGSGLYILCLPRIVVPRIAQSVDRFLRRLTEYR